MDKVLFSHNTDHWATPKWLYDLFINKIGCIDPCPLHCDTNNLKNKYRNKRLFVNPPYSAIDQWVDFIKNNFYNNFIFLLIPARTDTKYFYELMKLEPKVIFITGRLRFNDSNCAPFPSLLLIFGACYLVNNSVCLNHKELYQFLEDNYGKLNDTNS